MSEKSLYEDENLSYFKNPDINDIEQEELNEELLLSHDRQNFMDTISERIVNAKFIFILNKISVNTISFDYWETLLKKIGRIYGLNYLEPYVEIYRHNTSTEDIIIDIVDFIKFLKIDLISDIISGIINVNTTLDEFIEYLNSKSTPKIMTECVKYMDVKNYPKFIEKLWDEANS